MTRIGARPVELTEKQLRLLLETPDDLLQETFGGVPRWFLRSEKNRAAKLFPPQVRIDLDAARLLDRSKARESGRLYRSLLIENEKLRKEVATALNFPAVVPRDLIIKSKSGEREATAGSMMSDVHCEEEVTLESTNGINEYNLQIFDRRVKWYFANTVKLLHKEAQDINIRNLILAILGDLFSGSIHEDLAESNLLGPMDAAALAQDSVAGGIRYILKNTDPSLKITVVWKLGNHSRVTKKQRIQTETENSLEWLMVHSLARAFATEPRVKFIRERSLLTYVDVHGFPVRFLHGHAVDYQGGVGGITIPINKAIAQWDKGRRAHVTCMGHFHQLTFGSGFIVNGSMIGYNSFAVKIKAAPEPPRQAFFLIDAKHGLTVRAPILLEPV